MARPSENYTGWEIALSKDNHSTAYRITDKDVDIFTERNPNMKFLFDQLSKQL